MNAWWAITPLVLLATPQADAQTCTAIATPAAFGNYQPLSGANAMTTAGVTVTCNPGLASLLVSYTIVLGAGTGGSYAGRSMAGPQSRLSYQLYRDAGDTQIWGDGSAGTVDVTDGYTLGVLLPIVKNYTVYGRIGAAQNVAVGTYIDTIMTVVIY